MTASSSLRLHPSTPALTRALPSLPRHGCRYELRHHQRIVLATNQRWEALLWNFLFCGSRGRLCDRRASGNWRGGRVWRTPAAAGGGLERPAANRRALLGRSAGAPAACATV